MSSDIKVGFLNCSDNTSSRVTQRFIRVGREYYEIEEDPSRGRIS